LTFFWYDTQTNLFLRMGDHIYKLVLIGDSAVGKTSLFLRFVDGVFSESSANLTGIEFKPKTITIEGRPVHLQVFDTAGQERFRTITSSFYRNANGIMVVYDITDQATFSNVKSWMQEIQRFASASVSKVLVGNKSDLEDQRVVPSSTAKELADGLAIPFYETSAKTGANVELVFTQIAADVVRSQSRGTFGGSSGDTAKLESAPIDKGKKKVLRPFKAEKNKSLVFLELFLPAGAHFGQPYLHSIGDLNFYLFPPCKKKNVVGCIGIKVLGGSSRDIGVLFSLDGVICSR